MRPGRPCNGHFQDGEPSPEGRNQTVDVGARLEGRIELDQWMRREKSLLKLRFDMGLKPIVGDVEKTSNVGGVVIDQPLPQLKNVQSVPLSPRQSETTHSFIPPSLKGGTN